MLLIFSYLKILLTAAVGRYVFEEEVFEKYPDVGRLINNWLAVFQS